MNDLIQNKRFTGVSRLYGTNGLKQLQQSHVIIVGIGGVGSWTAEALARNAVGSITLIDLDHIAESNTNRQIHALDKQYGKAKVVAMAERIRAINPECHIRCIEEFITPENIDHVLGNIPTGFVVDAIDQVKAKTALIIWCKKRQWSLICCGAAGGKLDPTRIQIDDLSRTTQDALLAKVRSLLRKTHHFSKGSSNKNSPSKKMNIPVVYSNEAIKKPIEICETQGGLQGLNCAGYGSSVAVTATVGMAAAAFVLNHLVTQK